MFAQITHNIAILFITLFVLLAPVAAVNFFSWPLPTEKSSLRFRHLLGAIAMYVAPIFITSLFFFFITTESPDYTFFCFSISACAFVIYLKQSPAKITNSVLYSGSHSPSSFSTSIYSAVRMWVIETPITLIIGFTLNVLFNWLFPFEEAQPQEMVQELQNSFSSSTNNLVLILDICLLAPFVEEIFFRGFLQTFLKNRMSREKAIILSSILFALLHIESGSWGTLIFVPTIFIFSLFAGFLYEKERHITAPMVLHALYNATSVCITKLQSSLDV